MSSFHRPAAYGVPGGPRSTAVQCSRWSSETGARESRAGEGEEVWDFSSARRRFVAVGGIVGDGGRGESGERASGGHGKEMIQGGRIMGGIVGERVNGGACT